LAGFVEDGTELSNFKSASSIQHVTVDECVWGMWGEMERTYNPRIDPQFHVPLTPLTLRTCFIRKKRNPTTFIAHEHVALVWRDDIKLRQYHGHISHNLFSWIRARKVVHVCETIQRFHTCVLESFDFSKGTWERWVDMFFLGDALCEGTETPGISDVGVDVDAGVGVDGEFGGFLDAPSRGGDEEDGG
jgi:hypothetical protein